MKSLDSVDTDSKVFVDSFLHIHTHIYIYIYNPSLFCFSLFSGKRYLFPNRLYS